MVMVLDSVKFFQRFISQPEDLRQICVDWHNENKTTNAPVSVPARHMSCDYVGRKYNEAEVRFICEWAKSNPKQRKWDLCAEIGKYQKILQKVDGKKLSAAFSDFRKKDHKLHWVYQEVFGIK
jgi:hypothetical protein